MADQTQQKMRADDEIDLIELVITLWKGRKIIILSTLIGTMLGLGLAFLSPSQYAVRSQFISEMTFISQDEIEKFIRQTPEFVQIQTRINFEKTAKDDKGGSWSNDGGNLKYSHADEKIAQRQIIALYEKALPKAKNAATLLYERQLAVLKSIETDKELLSDPNASTKVKTKLALDELLAAERLGQLFLSEPKKEGTSKRLILLVGIILGGVIGTIIILLQSAIANYQARQSHSS